MAIEVNGRTIETDDNGNLVNYQDWDKDVSQALAAIRGRHYVIPDDLKELAAHVLAHRLSPSVDARLHGRTTAEVLASILEQTPVPVEEVWSERG